MDTYTHTHNQKQTKKHFDQNEGENNYNGSQSTIINNEQPPHPLGTPRPTHILLVIYAMQTVQQKKEGTHSIG